MDLCVVCLGWCGRRGQLRSSLGSVIYGLIGVRRSSRIGICDRDPAKTLAANFARALALRPFRIKEIIVFVGVSVRPAIHGYGSDIVRWIESAVAKNTRELISNISFERFERRR